jgi:hypothetical protein
LSEEDLQELTFELTRTLNRETDLVASLPDEKVGSGGTKGDAIALGQIILTALSSGTMVALFGVIRSYFERRSSLEVACERKDGEKFMIRVENLKPDRIDQTMKMAKEFFGGS